MYKDFLKVLYKKYNIENFFERDYKYLEESIKEINQLWISNFSKIEEIKLIILAEAPMWGKDKTYFYNPDSSHSQFFFQSDLKYIIKPTITNKIDLISNLNKNGIVILDFSPFPFNTENTKLSYKCDDKGRSIKIEKKDYMEILIKTFPYHLKSRLEIIKKKSNILNVEYVRICFRYSRVKKNLNGVLKKLLLQEGFDMIKGAVSISMKGGGIDKKKLQNEITQAKQKIKAIKRALI